MSPKHCRKSTKSRSIPEDGESLEEKICQGIDATLLGGMLALPLVLLGAPICFAIWSLGLQIRTSFQRHSTSEPNLKSIYSPPDSALRTNRAWLGGTYALAVEATSIPYKTPQSATKDQEMLRTSYGVGEAVAKAKRGMQLQP